jgi:hypothetical protein
MGKSTAPDSMFLTNQTYGIQTIDDDRTDEEWVEYVNRWMEGEHLVQAEPPLIIRKDGKVRVRVVAHWRGVNA